LKAILASPQLGAFVISVIIVLMFCAMCAYAMVHGLQDNAPLNQLTGALIAAFSTVYSFWIGSSSSSKNKDAVIAQQANTAATTGVPTNASTSSSGISLHS
jgi:hypothetical protein